MAERERPTGVKSPVTGPDGGPKDVLSEAQRLAWGNLFSITAIYQHELPGDTASTFERYLDDVNDPDKDGFIRTIGLQPFLPDSSGRPRGIVVTEYLDGVHTQLYIGMARWENDVPIMHSVEGASYSPYLLDYRLNAFELAEKATRVVLNEEAEVIGFTSGEPPDPYFMTEADEESEQRPHPYSEPVDSKPITGIVFTPPDSSRKN